MSAATHNRYCAFDARHLLALPELAPLSLAVRTRMRAAAAVLPFRGNPHVLSLIHWDEVPRDPIFQLIFPQPGMLDPEDEASLVALLDAGDELPLLAATRDIQWHMNPHPAGQLRLNHAQLEGRPIAGLQHKYRETVLWFPRQGQTCHAFCSFCFRWPQFIGVPNLRQANTDPTELVAYLRAHPEVTDVLVTGGDPMFMRTAMVARHLEPLLADDLAHVQNIRIGTKAPAFWPYRFTEGAEADTLMRLFERIVASGRTLAIMAHFVHPRELEPEVTRRALARIRATGAVVRCQAPVLRHINDDPAVWAELWRTEVELGLVPYYMFVARDTGPRRYFELSLLRAQEIYAGAYRQVSGLARTVRGPVMSATPGKVIVDGVAEGPGAARVFVLRFLQARDPAWVGRPFFAAFDPRASWLTGLRPADGHNHFFFEQPVPTRRGHHTGHEEEHRPRSPGWRHVGGEPR